MPRWPYVCRDTPTCSRPGKSRCTAGQQNCMTTSMSGGRTLAPESWTFEELAAAGWAEADLEWENAAEEALKFLASDDRTEARSMFARSVRVANEKFSN